MSTPKTTIVMRDFTSGNVTKQLLLFSAPLFLSNLLQIVYNMADMVIVGRAIGKIGLSAVSIGGDITNLLTFLAIGFSNAAQVIIAQYIGARQQQKLGRFISTMSSFLILCAAALSIVCLFLRTPLLSIMNTPAESWDQALAYTTVCTAGLLFVYGYNIISAILRGMGDSKHPFIFISIAAILNVLLDLLFVFAFHSGAMGAALATIISQAVSFFSCLFLLYRKREELGFQIHWSDFIHWDERMLKELIGLGIPMALKNASIQISKLFVNSWINSYGINVSAMAGIANKLTNICNLISNSVNTAGASMVGQNIGARKYRRVTQLIRSMFGVTLNIFTVLTILLLLFPRQIFGIFSTEDKVLELAMGYIPIAVLMFYGSACRAPMNALINGSGNYKINFATAILDGIILRIGFSLLFGLVLNMKYTGFWLGDAIAGFTPLWLGGIYYFSGKWKKQNSYIS